MEQTNNNIPDAEPTNQTATQTESFPQTPQTSSPMATTQMAPPTNESWRTILSILLIIFFGPIGIIVMWIVARWPKWVKGIITAVVLIPLILIFYQIILMKNWIEKRIQYSQNPNNSIADIPLPPTLTPSQNQKIKTLLKDSKIQGDIASWRSNLEIYYANHGQYPKCSLNVSQCNLSDLNLSKSNIGDYKYWSDGENYKIQFELEQKEPGEGPTYKGINCATNEGFLHGACL